MFSVMLQHLPFLMLRLDLSEALEDVEELFSMWGVHHILHDSIKHFNLLFRIVLAQGSV